MNCRRLAILALIGSLAHAGFAAEAPPAGKPLQWGTPSAWTPAPEARAPAAPGSALRNLPPAPAAPAPNPPPTATTATPTAPAGDIHQTKAFGPFTGAGFNINCGAGEYVVGFVGRAGAWFDQLTVACAPWAPGSNSIGSFHVLGTRAGSSGGGAPIYHYCNGNAAVNRLALQMIKEDPARMLLDNINFDCASLAPPHEVQETQTIETEEGSNGGFRGKAPDGNFSCAPEEFAVGIYGNADQSIHRLGLLCRAAPRAAFVPAPSARIHPTHALTASPPSPTAGGGRAQATVTPNWGTVIPRPTEPPPGVRNPPATPPPGAPSRPPSDMPSGPTPPVTVGNGLRFNYPYVRAIDGRLSLLDSCYAGASNCGRPVADAFCQVARARSSAVAVGYQAFRGTGPDGRTATLPSYNVCTGAACTGFVYVVCGP